MNKNSTTTGKVLLIAILTTFASNVIQAQTVPKLIFSKPRLVSGVAGKINATYLFPNVMTGVDAYVSIENIVNGAYLVNIDDSTLGYYNAWQPTVGGNGLYGSSYIKWDIQFQDKSGKKYKFPELDATAIDIDGDNVRVREFIGVNGQSTYSVPTQVPSLLTISNPVDTDDVNHSDKSKNNLIALGPVVNRTGIDTSSQDVRLNFTVKNVSEFKMYTGSQVDNNGNNGAIATDRYHCIYFQNIVGVFNVLPITYQSFNAALDNGAVDLGWTTGVEFLNDHFEVERSFDQTTFTAIGIVLGAQSVNNGVCQYNFQDKDDQISTQKLIYYRLKQVSTNNKVSYSAIRVIQVNNSTANKIAIQAMPNPYMDKLNVSFDSQQEGKAEMVMVSASGTIVKKIQANLVKGFNNFAFEDLSGQRAGLYVVTILVNGQSVGSRKIIKN